MTIEEVAQRFQKEYHDFEKAVHDISYDDNNKEYMFDDLSYRMYCYDDMIKSKLRAQETLKSVDGISIHDDYINFIEFKNGKITRDDLLGKVSQGMHYLQEVLLEKTYFSIEGIKTRFILVYNGEKMLRKNPSLDNLADAVAGYAKMPTDRWSLGKCFSEVWHFFDEAISLEKSQFCARVDEFVKK